MATLHDVLARARAAQQKIPPSEAAWLFAAVMRLAASQAATLRSRLVQIDATGAISLSPFDGAAAEDEPGYLAPELLDAEAPAKTEPRVQVYAAGALGYELLTGKPPPEAAAGIGAEPSGPLGDLVRVAMAKDRRERFASLVELRDAVDGVQKPIPADQERHAFAALLAKSERWGGGVSDVERAALAKLIEQTTQLQRQVEAVRIGIAEVQREHREVEARFRKLESGGKAPPVLAPRARSWPAGLIGGFLGAVAALATLFGAGALRAHAPEPLLPLLGAIASLGHGEGPGQAAPAEEKPKAHANEVADTKPAAQPPAVANSQAAWVIEVKPAAGAAPAVAAVPAPAAPAPAAPAPAAPASAAAEAKPAPVEHKPAVSSAEPAKPGPAAPRLALQLLQRGERELERGRVDGAVEAFRLAIQEEPKLAAAWRDLGTAYVLRHDSAAALAAYQKYLQLSPSADDRADIRRAMAELQANAHASADK